jgi:hypothetical protein
MIDLCLSSRTWCIVPPLNIVFHGGMEVSYHDLFGVVVCVHSGMVVELCWKIFFSFIFFSLFSLSKYKCVIFIYLFIVCNLVIVILIVNFFLSFFFSFFFNFISYHLISFNFYIKFGPYSFYCFFTFFLQLNLVFNFIPRHLNSNYFYIKFSLQSFNFYFFFVLNPFLLPFFLISPVIILLILNFALLFIRVCLLWD